MKLIAAIAATLGALLLGVALFVYSGRYNMGADAPHWAATLGLITTLRERSIAAHSADLQAPDLRDSALISQGAGHYAAMCVDCHLAPGVANSEIRPGLYPQPPDLANVRIAPKIAFWAIKHGIKMSAMPAWGASHDDAAIWSMVAFLQKLPDLDAAQYEQIVAAAPPDEDMEVDTGKDDADAVPGHTPPAADRK
jgi:mono/diheme cytochrome c family protein